MPNISMKQYMHLFNKISNMLLQAQHSVTVFVISFCQKTKEQLQLTDLYNIQDKEERNVSQDPHKTEMVTLAQKTM